MRDFYEFFFSELYLTYFVYLYLKITNNTKKNSWYNFLSTDLINFTPLLKLMICHVLYFKCFTTKALKKIDLMYFAYLYLKLNDNNELLYEIFCIIFFLRG